MIFITGPLYSGKRTFAKTLPGRCICDVQELAAGAENLENSRTSCPLTISCLPPRWAAAWYPWTPPNVPDAKPPGGWPACWPHGQSAWCRCSAASPPF